MQSFRAGGKIEPEALNPNQEGNVKINEYFKAAKGRGVLATADSSGKVDVAVYTIPHVIDEGSVAFIMPDKPTPTQPIFSPKKKKSSRECGFF
jgi:hypothetical protein